MTREMTTPAARPRSGLPGGRGSWLVGVVAMALAACHPPPGARDPGASREAAPRLLITIVVDQLPAWLAESRWPALPETGGFARLRREGLTVHELRYDHAVTDTAPGHAALYTGAVPRRSGIFANEVLGDDGKPRSILLDATTHVVDVRGATLERAGSSLARLRVETLADALVTTTPGARVYSFSLKDRGALPAAGRHPTVALWLDVASDSFVTSTAFPAPPAWAAPLADRAALVAARAGGWTLDDADRRFVAAHATTPDDQPGEGDLAGLGRTFPHAVGSTKALRATPIGDRVLFALARAALVEIGARGAAPPTLLALSLSSNDYVAHVFGPQSWEAWAAALELDRQLAALLDEADRAVGTNGYAVLLTSDHGGGALPEVSPQLAGVTCPPTPAAATDPWERACRPRRRLMPAEAVAALEAAATTAVGPGPWAAGFAEPYIYLTPRGRALAGGARARFLRAIAAALRPLGIAEVVDARQDAAPCRPGDGLDDLVCRAIDPTGPGDLYLVVDNGAFFDPDVARGAGTSHGSPYLYDRAVPLLVRAPGRVPAGQERRGPVAFATFARTAAALLGIRLPAGAGTGEDLAP
jgi:arylsulfatase A-like enzyme